MLACANCFGEPEAKFLRLIQTRLVVDGSANKSVVGGHSIGGGKRRTTPLRNYRSETLVGNCVIVDHRLALRSLSQKKAGWKYLIDRHLRA